MGLRDFEWIGLAYFVYLAAAAAAKSGPVVPRRRVLVVAVLVAASIPVLARLGDGPTALALRDWMPLAHILLGYRLPALLVTSPDQALERALLAFDRRSFGPEGLARFGRRAPRALVEFLELSYLFCYPLVPAGFACVYAASPHEEIDRFWMAVFLAVFPCYGLVPWFPTRPPRVLEDQEPAPRSRLRPLNLAILGRASIQLNTLPSGHAAASLATAMAVSVSLPWAGIALGVIAAGITTGSVLRRYHYAADAFGGAVLAVAGFVVSRLAW